MVGVHRPSTAFFYFQSSLNTGSRDPADRRQRRRGAEQEEEEEEGWGRAVAVCVDHPHPISRPGLANAGDTIVLEAVAPPPPSGPTGGPSGERK